MMVLYGWYFPSGSAGRDYCQRRGVLLTVSTIIACMAFIDFGDDANSFTRCMILAASAVPILITELNSLRVENESQHPYTELLTERYGMMTMIMLGESILSLILVKLDVTNMEDHNKFNLSVVLECSFGTCFLLFFMYFRGHVEGGDHALDNGGFPGGLIWIFFHYPLACALIANSVSLKYFSHLLTLSAEEKEELDR
eukprot:UN25597